DDEHRRTVADQTLAAAAAHDRSSLTRIPARGTNPAFDSQLQDAQWREPLYLMMAALVWRQRVLAGGARADDALLWGFSLSRADLAFELAKKERRRLDLFVPRPEETLKRLFRHLAACVTLCGGLSFDETRDTAAAE